MFRLRERYFNAAILIVAGVVLTIVLVSSLRRAAGSHEDAILVPPDPLDFQPPSWSSLRTFKRGAVCADGVPCASIGRSMLERNGSAMDAALAALICNGMVNMQSMGLGGGFLLTAYEKASERAFVLNARDAAPLAAHVHMFDNLPSQASRAGGLAVAVPGELAGYWEAHERFGKLPWADLFWPSIELCENGYNLTKPQYGDLFFNKDNIYGDPVLREWFIDPETRTFRKPGSIIRPKELCKTLRIIAERGASELYNGSLGRFLVEDVQRRGGVLSMQDLRQYRAKWEEPVATNFSDGTTLYSSGLPGSGAVLAFILNILEGYRFSAASIASMNETVKTYHRIAEAFKFAYAIRSEMGDQDFVDMEEITRNLTSKDYARLVREKIDENRTFNDPEHYGVTAESPEDHGTSHISVLAPNGDAVSVTSTVNLYFGSGVVSERTGILLNSGMDDFGLPSRHSYFGLPPSRSNLIEPGKRPLSSMAPSVLVDQNGGAKMAIGAAGGTKITTALAFVIARYLWMNNSLKEAVDASRIHHQLFPMKLLYEYGVPNAIIDGLRKLDHHTERYRDRGSIVCGLLRVNGTVFANADFRKGGDVYGID
ncbi:glutathione hydrolase 1 proenzyme [Orussus abietinus]|uniref:glutathione hydrolase 1 proenzyme n=1 Tax=Orussus abietinus TaxID=222816 RepID=UPI0006262414|nr:glutathione hydrolase 1 proenzyme [Orussus abietinus]